jgi:predicted ferric reductase
MIGIISIVSAVLSTILLFFMSKTWIIDPNKWITYLAQLTGLIGSVLISINFIISIKNNFIERTFGGLDKLYKIHNIIGNVAFIFILNHPVFLILNSLPLNTTRLYLIPKLSNLPYAFGILALYILIILVILTIFVDMPYKIWKKTHETMGLVIIFGSLHSLLITSDVSIYMPLRFWILGINILALVAYIYKRYIYYLIQPKNNYRIINIDHNKNYLLITLKAIDPENIIIFQPGQFAFFSLDKDTRDEHPFSIFEQENSIVKIGVKITGSFTLGLSQLKIGDEISVRGPFGFFGNSLRKANESVWISAGIGITPFLSMLKSLRDDQIVTMIHSARNDEPTIFTNYFNNLAKNYLNFKFVIHYPSIEGRLNEENIRKYVNLSKQSYVYLCGPKALMDDFSHKLPSKGVLKKRIIFEDFSFK